MNQAELVSEVAKNLRLSKRKAEILVQTTLRGIIESLKAGARVEIRGFGSFRLRERGPRRGRNPRTGRKVDVPAKRVSYFKPAKALKRLINS